MFGQGDNAAVGGSRDHPEGWAELGEGDWEICSVLMNEPTYRSSKDTTIYEFSGGLTFSARYY